MRVYAHGMKRTFHGLIVQLLIDDTQVTNRVRRVMVTWDGYAGPVEVDPADLRRETPAPIHDLEKLERWLDT